MKYVIIATVRSYSKKDCNEMKEVNIVCKTKREANMINQGYLDAGYNSKMIKYQKEK